MENRAQKLATGAALLLVLRGVMGTLGTLSRGVEGSASSASVIMPLSIVGFFLLFVAKGIVELDAWGWFGGAFTTAVFVLSDVALTVMGTPQHPAEIAADLLLAAFFVTQRSEFENSLKSVEFGDDYVQI